jgi:hypothetical protein
MFLDLSSSDEEDAALKIAKETCEAEKGFTVSVPVIDVEGYY